MRVDSGTENRGEFIKRAYPGQFLENLAMRLNLPPFDAEMVKEIKGMGWTYIVIRNEDPAEKKQIRQEYQELKRAIERFVPILREAEQRDFSSDIDIAARRLCEPRPKTDFPDLTEHQKQRGEPYLRELFRLLNIAKSAAEHQLMFFSNRRGPRINSGLAMLVKRAAAFFEIELHQPFTIDHQKPFKPTKAFDFVRALIGPLDDEVSDDEIVTAIRAELAERRKLIVRNVQ
jgi:hypothetical protein